MLKPPPLADASFQDPVRLADWIEINLLTNEEKVVSILDVTDELADTPTDQSADTEMRFDNDPQVTREGQIKTGYWESAEQLAELAFQELNGRKTWLRDHYPIEIEGDTAELDVSSVAKEVYQFLVLLRARQLYPGGLEDDGGESGVLFEELVKYAMGSYIACSPHQQVRFGLAVGTRGDGLPDGVHDAVHELSQRMFEAPGQIHSSAQGDFRADAVAWKSFGDLLPGQLTIICQATISEREWIRKEPASRWTDKQPPEDRLIRFLARPVTAVAFPETLSLLASNELGGLVFSSIPFDRLRLLSVLLDSLIPQTLRSRMQMWGDELAERIPR